MKVGHEHPAVPGKLAVLTDPSFPHIVPASQAIFLAVGMTRARVRPARPCQPRSTPALPRRREIEAAIAAYNDADPEILLPPDAARLLSVMFRRSSVCQRSEAHLAAEASETMRLVKRLLRILRECPANGGMTTRGYGRSGR